MRPVMRLLATLAIPAALLAVPASAGAFGLTNCTLALTSLDANKIQIDSAASGAPDSTQDNPFLIDWAGTVEWNGTMDGLVTTNHHWHVDIFGLPTTLSGSDPNEAGDTNGDGTVDVGANVPFRFTGLYYVSGAISGTGGACDGSGWMKVNGDPLATIPFWAGIVILLVGLLLAWYGWRGSWPGAVVGGLLFGLGAAILLVTLAFLPLGSITPLATVVVGLLLGIAVRLFGGSTAPAPDTA